jgi:hypothetical protein
MDFPTHPDHDTGVESLDMDMVHDFGGQVEGLDMRDFQTTEVDDGLDDKGHLGEFALGLVPCASNYKACACAGQLRPHLLPS